MNRVHAIHLGNAWEVEPGDEARPAAWIRRFGLPTGLAAGDAVWLVIDAPVACGLALNGEPLPGSGPEADYRVEVTARLRGRNLLVVVPRDAAHAPRDPPPRGPLPATLGHVRLEIVPAGE